MQKRNEESHKKTVAKFGFLVSHCEILGTSYNPANPTITLSALQAAKAAAGQAMVDADMAKNAYFAATDTREILFADLATFTSRVVGALQASGVPVQTVDNAKVLLRKLRGQRAPDRRPKTDLTKTEGPLEPAGTPVGPGGTLPEPAGAVPVRRISTSQRSYDMQAGHFSRLALMLSAEPLYIPNEPELSAAGLLAHHDALAAANEAVYQSIAAHKNANDARDLLLYGKADGLVDRGNNSKQYIKSVFGPSSPQYKAVARIQFKKPY